MKTMEATNDAGIIDLLTAGKVIADAEERAKRSREDAEAVVAELNKQHAVVIVGGKAVIMREQESSRRDGGLEMSLMDAASFKLFHANQSVWVESATNGGKGDPKGKYVTIGDWWLKSPQRRTYKGLTFRPSGNAPDGFYNLWHGFAVEPRDGGMTDNKWKCSRLLSHMLDNICRGNAEHYQYLLYWLADMIQDPEVKKGVALVMRGDKGSGKSKLADIMRKLLGSHAMKISQSKHLVGNFNQQLSNKLLIVSEEATYAGNKSEDGVMKDLVTSDTVTIEAKRVDPIEVDSCCRIMMTTNSEWAVPATSDERRYFVLDVGNDHRKDYAYFAAIDAEMYGNDNEGLRALLAFLQAIDLSGVNLRDVPQTDALRQQVALSMDVPDKFIQDALVSGRIAGHDWWIGGRDGKGLAIDKVSLHAAYLEYTKAMGKSRPMDLAQFCKHFAKRIEVSDTRPRVGGKQGPRLFQLPTRNEAIRQFAATMRIDLDHLLDDPELF
jgi:energy-coupling factor transporter ATP-binding protein EcfA2